MSIPTALRNSAQTLVVVIAVLAVVFLTGAAFFILSQAERLAGVRNVDSIRARYLAEAGVAYAEKIIKADKSANLIDSLEDVPFSFFNGTDIDLNQDGATDARWVEVKSLSGTPFGRFAVKVSDEASKVNINTCAQGVLEQLFSKIGLASDKASGVISYRPLFALEQAGAVLGKDGLNKGRDYITVYGRDFEIDLEGHTRTYLNSSSPNILAETFLARGIRGAYQKAVNIKDTQDADCAQSILDQFSLRFNPTALSEAGGWSKIGNYYEAPAGSAAGKFTWSNMPVEDGDYYCYFIGVNEGEPVGHAYTAAESEAEYLLAGEGLMKKVQISGGSLSLYIKPDATASSRFTLIELVSTGPEAGFERKTITGTDAVVINELMPKPAMELSGISASIPPGEEFSHTFSDARPGVYYAAVLAANTGGYVGDVTIEGQATGSEMSDKDYFSQAIEVGSDGQLTVKVKNNSLKQGSFKGLKLSQQPDNEFIEVLNLSPQEIDMGGFSFSAYNSDGDLLTGWPASVPAGTKIQPYQYLVFTVDNDDSPSQAPSHIAGSKVYFRKEWGFDAAVVSFEGKDTITKESDLLPDSGARLVLSNPSGDQADAIEYRSMQVTPFTSLERGDPSSKSDLEGNGYFDGWYSSEADAKATPGSVNENWGMYVNGAKHTPGEIKVFNRALTDLSEIQQVSNGENWKKISAIDVIRMTDRFAHDALDLELKGHYLSGDFQLSGDVYLSASSGQSGIWEFKDVAQGRYFLSILSDDFNSSGQKVEVSAKLEGEDAFSSPAPASMNQGIVFYGAFDLDEDTMDFQLKVTNDSDKQVRLKTLRLEPVNSVIGRINVNTAKEEVLSSLFSSATLTEAVLKNRPLGLKDNRKLGLGDLLVIDLGFLPFLNSLTLRSDVYEVLSRGEYTATGSNPTFQTIRSVVQRGE